MEPIKIIKGKVMPLERSNVDTDQIIPASWLKMVNRTGFQDALFSEWRKDSSFVLNDPDYRDSTILLAGANFGIGSSREHAIWAIQDWGFKAVISSKFSDIFKNNAVNCSLVPVEVSEKDSEALFSLASKNKNCQLVIDIERRTVTNEDGTIQVSFNMADFDVYRFLNGLDYINLALVHLDRIKEFREKRPNWLPKLSAP